MSLEYRWIINSREIEENISLPTERPSTWDAGASEEFIKRSFQRGCIDANELSRVLFPHSGYTGKDRVFISHPHSCCNAARKIKAFLSEKYDCFVDVDVWGQADCILQHIQRMSGKLLSLQKCNAWAAHMYLLLSRAIMEEIARSRIVIYIESGSDDNDIIHSPWLYFELSVVKELVAAGNAMLKEANMSAVRTPVMEYNIQHLTKAYTRINAGYLQTLLEESSPGKVELRACLGNCMRGR